MISSMQKRVARCLVLALCSATCAEAPPPPPAQPAIDVQYEEVKKPEPPKVAEEKPAEPTYWKGKTDLIRAPAPPVPAELNLPPDAVKRWKMKNGLDVIVVPRKDLPVASFSLAVKAGGYDEVKDRQGVASFTASMLRKGTKKRTADEISKAIDFVGGSLDAYGGQENSGANCTALSKDKELCITLLAEILLSATFPEEEMQEVRDQMIASLNQRFDNPGALASEHFSNLLYGEKHPDGWVMTPDDVKKITRQQLIEFWATYYRPNNAILAVAGDVDVAKLKTDLEKAFGGWEAVQIPPRAEMKIPELKGTRMLLVDKPDLTQTTIVFGHKGIRHADPEWYAVTMMNYVLGGSDFSSRLTREVRSKRGLTYGIGSSFGQSLYEGAFRVSTSTKNASAWSALVAAVDEIRKMKTEGPTEEELAKGKGYYAGSYPFRLQSAEGIAQSIVAAELHGLGIPYVRQFPLRIARVDTAKARQAAADWLQPDNIVVVIVGKAAEVEPQLKAITPPLKYEKIAFKDPISVAVRRAARKAEEQAALSGEDGKAMALVKQAIAAHGGEAAMRAVKEMSVKRQGTTKVQGADADLEIRLAYRRPGDLRFDQETMTPQGTHKVALLITPKGLKGDMGDGNMRAPRPNSPFIPVLRRLQFLDNNFVLLNVLDAKPEGIRLAPPANGMEGITFKGPGGDPVTLYFDAKTHLLARTTFKGLQQDKTEDYSDYKPTAGVKFARKIVTSGEETSEETVRELQVNAGVDAKLFE